jgi:hypothetical protein
MTVESSVAALFERRLRSPSSNRTNASRGWPQRRPFVFVDPVPRLDAANGLTIRRYDVQQDWSPQAGHIRGRPACRWELSRVSCRIGRFTIVAG